MKINPHILCIPPYISTSWKNVDSIHCIQDTLNGKILVITMHNGSIIEIPDLAETAVHEIFLAHNKFLEKNETPPTSQNPIPSLPKLDPLLFGGENSVTFGFPIKMNAENLPNFGLMMHHNPELSDSPPIPTEVLDKIKIITQSIGIHGQLDLLPKAEPHCHCPYCQLAKVLHQDEKTTPPLKEVDAIVTDEELKFREWDIKQVDDKLYNITNPFDSNEHFQVYLGHPLGCTCGEKNCEHIKAVLSS